MAFGRENSALTSWNAILPAICTGIMRKRQSERAAVAIAANWFFWGVAGIIHLLLFQNRLDFVMQGIICSSFAFLSISFPVSRIKGRNHFRLLMLFFWGFPSVFSLSGGNFELNCRVFLN